MAPNPGYDLRLMRQINNRVNIPTIASGGVGCLQHLGGILGGQMRLGRLYFPFWSIPLKTVSRQGLRAKPNALLYLARCYKKSVFKTLLIRP